MPRRWLIVTIPQTVIEVNLVSDDEMRDEVGDHDGADGAYDDDLRQIAIRKTLSYRERREVLIHECGHMGLDVALQAIRKALGRRRPAS